MAKLSSTKGYYGMLKGIVISGDDPKNLGRLEVLIPSLHGNKTKTDIWAQCSVTKVPGGIFGLGQTNSISPSIGDTVWLVFEGGDINFPVIVGILASSATQGGYNGVSGATNIANIGSGILDIMKNIIYAVESGGNVYGKADYSCFVEAYHATSSEHAITIGAGQWMGVEGRTLMQKIYQSNQNEFTRLDNVGLSSDIQSDWSRYKVSKNSPKGKAIISIITTETGKKCQDELMIEQCTKYMQEAQEFGVTDIAAQMEFVNIKHQGGMSAAKRIFNKAKKPWTLESVYQALSGDTGNQVGAYKSRQNMVYNTIKEARDSGKLISTGTSSNLTSIPTSNGETTKTTMSSISLNKEETNFIFPMYEYKKIVKQFGYETSKRTGKQILHNGIDIYDENINCKPVLAVFGGTVSFETDINPINGCGLKVIITRDNKEAIYCHLSKRLVKEGDYVNEGDKIGLVGDTGSAIVPHLHFSIKVNGGYQNPLLYLKNY